MGQKLIRLRYAGACTSCSSPLARGATAWWDQTNRSVQCTICRPEGDGPSPHSTEIDVGTPGASSFERYERLHANRQAEIESKWGRFAGVVKFLSDDPQSTKAWRNGSEGERRLAACLEELLGDRIVLLNDRRVPRTHGNIDHLAVAASGVWVIDAKQRKGLIECRDVGGWFRVDRQLYVGGRRQTKLVDDLGWQVSAVHESLGSEGVPLHAAVCFVDGEWRLFARPFELNGVYVSWPRRLAEKISQDGPLSPEVVLAVASQLAKALPAKSPHQSMNRDDENWIPARRWRTSRGTRVTEEWLRR